MASLSSTTRTIGRLSDMGESISHGTGRRHSHRNKVRRLVQRTNGVHSRAVRPRRDARTFHTR